MAERSASGYTERYAEGMAELEKGAQGPQGARERILSASRRLFRNQGINRTGMDQLCAAAQVSKGTAYKHFTGKDELVAEYLRRVDPDVMPAVFDRTDLTPRERLLAAVEGPATGTQDITPVCPFIAAAVEIHDPQHPAVQYARDHRRSIVATQAGRNRPRSRRHQPRTARRATGAAHRWRLGPLPGPQRRVLPHRRRHRRGPHRQRHPHDRPAMTAESLGSFAPGQGSMMLKLGSPGCRTPNREAS